MLCLPRQHVSGDLTPSRPQQCSTSPPWVPHFQCINPWGQTTANVLIEQTFFFPTLPKDSVLELDVGACTNSSPWEETGWSVAQNQPVPHNIKCQNAQGGNEKILG